MIGECIKKLWTFLKNLTKKNSNEINENENSNIVVNSGSENVTNIDQSQTTINKTTTNGIIGIGFLCKRTKSIKDITGDKTPFTVPFEECNMYSRNGAITVDKKGVYELSWKIELKGITNQTEASVMIEGLREKTTIHSNNINSLKANDGRVILSGKLHEVEVDGGDRVELKVSIGNKENNKKIHLIKSNTAYFRGALVGN